MKPHVLSCLVAAGLSLLSGCTNPEPTLRLQQLNSEAASSTFGSFNSLPESPDGRYVAYLEYDQTPEKKNSIVPAKLCLYDRETQTRRELIDIPGMPIHDGARSLWISNELLVYQSGKMRGIITAPDYDTYNGDPQIEQVNVINIKTGENTVFPILGRIGHNTANGWFPVSVMHSMNGYHGIYLVHAESGEIRKVCDPTTFEPVVTEEFKKNHAPPSGWRLLHASINPAGTKLTMRLDMLPEEGVDAPIWHLLTAIHTDGTHPVFMGLKPLHGNWYDNDTIAGHAGGTPSLGMNRTVIMAGSPLMEGTDNQGGVYRFSLEPLKRLERLAPMGNHLGWSPDRNWYVSENWYQADRVIMRLYHKGVDQPAAILMDCPYGERVWGATIHANPSFSRDGRRIYFTEVIDGYRFQASFVDIGPIIDHWNSARPETILREDIVDEPAPETEPETTDLSVSASDFFTPKNSEISLVEKNAIDGDMNTDWGSAKKGSWLQVDLQKESQVSGVKIAWGGNHQRHYKFTIAASTDGTNWSEVYAGEHDGRQRQFKNYTFAQPVNARHLRIITDGYDVAKGGGGGGTFAYIAEIKVTEKTY